MHFFSLAALALAAETAMAQGFTPVGKGKPVPTAPAMSGGRTSQGCFSSSGNLTLVDTPQFNSISGCGELVCMKQGYKVGATTGGNQCWCGNEYPPKSSRQPDMSACNTTCVGYDPESCGGDGFWAVYNTGLEVIVPFAKDPTTSTTSAGSSPTKATVPETVVVSESGAPPSAPKSNTGAIVAGAVVGVVAVLGIAGGAFFFLRRRRNRSIEDEHRRNVAVNSFIHGHKPGSSTSASINDTRLDPVMAQRRMSDGSIADNEDYSRKILRVTNA